MIYILHQQGTVSIRIQSKKSCLRHIFLREFCLRLILFIKSHACGQYLSRDRTSQWPILVTTLVAAVSNNFVWQLPCAYAPRGTNENNRTRGRQLGVVLILIETVWLMIAFITCNSNCLRVNVLLWSQIQVDLSSRVFEFLLESNRRPRD